MRTPFIAWWHRIGPQLIIGNILLKQEKITLKAIEASGVKRVVNLSSMGAHLNGGTGPIAGLFDVEQILNTLDGVSDKHLRAGNFFLQISFSI
jgi:uncharacterized protein YbjT (DUF2867 family)